MSIYFRFERELFEKKEKKSNNQPVKSLRNWSQTY